MMNSFYAVALIFVLLGVAPAAAQGTSSSAGDTGQALGLTASASGGYDDNLAANGPTTGDPRFQVNGEYADVSSKLNYSATGRSVSFGASGFSGFRYYNTRNQVSAHNYGGSSGLSAALGRRVNFTGSIGASRATQYSIWVFPGVPEPPLGQMLSPYVGPASGPTYGLSAVGVTSVQSSAGMSYHLSKRDSLTLDYGFGNTTYDGSAINLKMRNYAGRYTHGITRYASLRIGYGQQQADYGVTGASKVRYGSVDAGIDYGRPLSRSRRTKLTFGFGSNSIDTVGGGATFWTIAGHADLSHEFKVWDVNLAYSRGVQLVTGLTSPLIADGVTATASGHYHRVKVAMSTGYSHGLIGVSQPTFRNFGSYTGSARTDFAIFRRFGVFGEYAYYHYLFDSHVQLPEGTPHALDRQGLSAGLSLTVPLLQERKSRVTR